MARNRTACRRPTPRPVSARRCHYLKAIQAPGSDDADKVVAELREMKINDFMTKDGRLREHARVMRNMYFEEVKSAAESKYPFDYFKILATIPAGQALRR
jgi:branched-chain amino acid transport system substrate-binding protein